MSGCRDGRLVSIVTPARDSGLYIAETIESVLAQTYPAWEMLIVDDGSADDTADIARKYAAADRRVRLIALPANVGAAAARNIGIRAARGRFVAFLDSDDLWLAEKLRAQVKFMTENSVAFSYTSYRRFGAIVGRLVAAPEKTNYKSLLKGNAIACSTVMIDRGAIEDVYMPEKAAHEDYITWLRLLKEGRVAYGLRKYLAMYRERAGSLSGDKLKSARAAWKVYREAENLPFCAAAYYFCHYAAKGFLKHYWPYCP
ncbi:MAG: glycosyltransferase family 2 protein [Acidaminococcales bacterium]|nr:glycosyltransferase family 2 protein [Acidaminococcales bacterium]